MKFLFYVVMFFLMLSANCVAQVGSLSTEATSSENYQSMTFNGVWSWFSDPRAVYFEGKHKRTYAGWIDNYGDVHIGYYDHETHQINSKVIYDNLEVDDHDNPSILINNEGRLFVFFNTHLQDERPLFFCKSLMPESINEWSEVQELSLNDEEKYRKARILRHTYTNPVQLSEESESIYLFWRGVDLKPSFSVSKDEGETWSAGKILFQPDEAYDIKSPYTKVYSDGVSKIHFTFTDGHPTKEKKNGLYYMYYEKGAFYKANGRKIKDVSQLPILQSELDIIFESDTVKSWNWDIAQDKNGDPIVTYVKFPQKDQHVYAYATFENNQWKSYDVITVNGWFPKTRENSEEPEPHYAGGIVIDHESPNTIYLSVKRKGVFEIEQWTTKNRGKSWKIQEITKNSTKDNVRPFAVRGAKKGNPLQVLWLQNTNYIYYAFDTRGRAKPIDFSDRYHTSVKMNLKKPTVNTELTKANVKAFLRYIVEQQLESKTHTKAAQNWLYNLFFRGVNAFYEISGEDRYINELLNFKQVQTDETEDGDEHGAYFNMYNLIWSSKVENARLQQQKIEALTSADFVDFGVGLKQASMLTAIRDFTTQILEFESLTNDFAKEIDVLLNEIDFSNNNGVIQHKILALYSLAAGINDGIFDEKYTENIKNSWKQLQQIYLENDRYKKLTPEASGAILLAGKEIYLLLKD